jgi:PIN domain nuclease of toxin-antitoxin system
VLKSALGKIGIEPVPFSTEIERLGFRWLDIANDHILNVPQLPRFPDHKDPFDRLLIAQAQVESAVFLTADSTLARYGNVIRVV